MLPPLPTTPQPPATSKHGALLLHDQQNVDALRSLAKELVKKFAKTIFTERKLMRIHFPVKPHLYSKCSFTELLIDQLLDVQYLIRANSAVAKERFELVVSYVMSYLYRTTLSRTYKPFNPLIGEVYFQEFSIYGYKVVAQSEQVANHPPTTLYKIEVFDQMDKFVVSVQGQVQFVCDMSLNHMVISRNGLNLIEFSDGSQFIFDLPKFRVQNM